MENHEEDLEEFWFKVFAKKKDADLHTWFCIDKIEGRPKKVYTFSDFVTCASCIFYSYFCLWDAKFLLQRVQDAMVLPTCHEK